MEPNMSTGRDTDNSGDHDPSSNAGRELKRKGSDSLTSQNEKRWPEKRSRAGSPVAEEPAPGYSASEAFLGSLPVLTVEYKENVNLMDVEIADESSPKDGLETESCESAGVGREEDAEPMDMETSAEQSVDRSPDIEATMFDSGELKSPESEGKATEEENHIDPQGKGPVEAKEPVSDGRKEKNANGLDIQPACEQHADERPRDGGIESASAGLGISEKTENKPTEKPTPERSGVEHPQKSEGETAEGLKPEDSHVKSLVEGNEGNEGQQRPGGEADSNESEAIDEPVGIMDSGPIIMDPRCESSESQLETKLPQPASPQPMRTERTSQ
ncbi:hypothetical protein BDV06DRAFT_33718 [Aspergillus oleicola]